jgi:hypothetical protein
VWIEAPSTNIQAPENIQTPITKPDFSNTGSRLAEGSFSMQVESELELVVWSFSGAWCLEVGAFATKNSPNTAVIPWRSGQIQGVMKLPRAGRGHKKRA